MFTNTESPTALIDPFRAREGLTHVEFISIIKVIIYNRLKRINPSYVQYANNIHNILCIALGITCLLFWLMQKPSGQNNFMYQTKKVIKSQFNPRAHYYSFIYSSWIPYLAILLDEIEKYL